MKCPHCLVMFHDEWLRVPLQLRDEKGLWFSSHTVCPSCKKAVIKLETEHKAMQFMAYPRKVSRGPLPPEVQDPFRSLFIEACNVLSESARASAALSRRCLQDLLREKAGTKSRDLADQIEEIVDSGKLPADLIEDLDAVRNIGNFGTHTQKSKNTGEILDVEPGEAEWNLSVLEELFDYFFVRPSEREKKRAALNAKLTESGKPPLKQLNP